MDKQLWCRAQNAEHRFHEQISEAFIPVLPPSL